ncbi:MAG: FAD-binding oxidoreductase [Burkholderiaceae bacterium]
MRPHEAQTPASAPAAVPDPEAVAHLRPKLAEVLGAGGLLLDADVRERGSGGRYNPPLRASVLARPANTAELAGVMRLCHDARVPVVVHGGMTGLVNACEAEDGTVVVSLERMNRIERVDAVQRVAIVQAGATLQSVQEAAQAVGLFFPLDLGARGSCSVGGNASTNAGGNRVIRYGMMRDMILGLEVVLADGTVLESLNTLIKNNTGYDLKHVFIGAEGTLGIITRLSLRLRESAAWRQLALVSLPDFEAVQRTLRAVDRGLGGGMSAFEVMWPEYYRLVTEPPATNRRPLPADAAFYVLIEAEGGGDVLAGRERFESVIGECLEAGDLVDAAIAQNEREAQDFWAIRDDVRQMWRIQPIQGFDVSLPIAEMPAYIDGVRARLRARWPESRLFVLGHLGDGNLHVTVNAGSGSDDEKFAIEQMVYEPLLPIGGAVSAEHGIGLMKKAWLPASRKPAEIAAMRRMKMAFDPLGILNPGRIFD